MVDLTKIKERLDAQVKKTKGGGQYEKKEKLTCFYRCEEPGKQLFRCVPYPHTADPEAEPFAEKHYHFNIPGYYAAYCPQKNDQLECAVCEFVWENMKALKGTTDKDRMSEWRERLPQLQVMVPGYHAGQEDEDGNIVPSATKEFKFLKFRSDFEKMSETHKKLYGFFKKEPLWMSWGADGFNLELTYETPKGDQKMRFNNIKAMLSRGGLELVRKNSAGFSSKKEYEQFVATIPNLDEFDTFAKKSPEDMIGVLEKWQEIAAMLAAKAGAKVAARPEMRIEAAVPAQEAVAEVQVEQDETLLVKAEAAERKTIPEKNVVKLSKLEQKLASMGLKA